MGVHGLWRLIEPSGNAVPLETLENKVLAVDISIWIHQAVKAFQDARGQQVANAHLLSLYHRICKLLYFKIKPIFVYDGGVPVLKRQVIAKRSQLKIQKINEANDVHKQLIKTLLKHSAVNKILSENTKAKISKSYLSLKRRDEDDIYKLPEAASQQSQSEEEEAQETSVTTETDTDSISPVKWDLYKIDENSEQFKSLPIEMKHDILTQLRESRKQSSWHKIHEMPRRGDGFSDYQMRRLLKRHSVQVSLEEIEKEVGGHALSLDELDSILKDHGVITTSKVGHHIASDENVRYVLIKDVEKAIENAKKVTESKTIAEIDSINGQSDIKIVEEVTSENSNSSKRSPERSKSQEKNEEICKFVEEDSYDEELERDLKKAIELSLQDVPSTSAVPYPPIDILSTKTDDISLNLEQYEDEDFQSSSSESDDPEENMLTVAQNYMVEYSGLSPNEIAKILQNELPKRKKDAVDVHKNETMKHLEKPNLKKLIGKHHIQKNTEDLKVDESKTTKDDAVAESSDSDSSDFVEVVDGDTNNHNVNTKTDTMKNSNEASGKESENSNSGHLEIVIKTNENPDEDDIFADVFTRDMSQQSETSPVPEINSQPIVSSDTSSISRIVTIPKHVQQIPEEKKENENQKEKDVKETLNEFMKEHASDIGVKLPAAQITDEQLKLINDKLELHKDKLISKYASKERLGDNITDQMYKETQELLELFGIPYVIAPMEAEAQCAFLNAIDLTDGTITDDSDIWLFGGKTVYKDFFNSSKHVKEFRVENIHHVFKLSREQMILFALLVGSDYTAGIQGIGPVTALEILAAFPIGKQQQLLAGLEEFRQWLLDGKRIGPGRTVLRSKLKNVKVVESFPSQQVMTAYLEPTVDNNKEEFSWGKPDMCALIEYAKKVFGWKETKSEEILKPILRRMKDNLSQKSIKDYFKIKHKIKQNEPDTLMSKRVKKAVQRIGKEHNGTDSDEEVEILKETKARSKKRSKQIEKEAKESANNSNIKLKKLNVNLHNDKKECIPQREKDKAVLLRSKLKAIEVFRKSKQGPGYVQKRRKVSRKPKHDAELSESSTD